MSCFAHWNGGIVVLWVDVRAYCVFLKCCLRLHGVFVEDGDEEWIIVTFRIEHDNIRTPMRGMVCPRPFL